jgi:hypothetical protein
MAAQRVQMTQSQQTVAALLPKAVVPVCTARQPRRLPSLLSAEWLCAC